MFAEHSASVHSIAALAQEIIAVLTFALQTIRHLALDSTVRFL
jgi:hypothetical protein